VVRRWQTPAPSRRRDPRRSPGSAKRLELDAKDAGLKVTDPEEEAKLPLDATVAGFLKDIKTFRKPLTWRKYEHILELFSEHVAPKSDVREITAEDVKAFLAWRKSKGFDPGTTLYTDRVILHNFFNRLKIDNPVKDVPRLPKFRKRPSAYTDADPKRFFGACDEWERAFFSVALAAGLRRGELQTLHWSDLDLARRRVHVTAKPEYSFLPKDWEERTVPLTQEVVRILKKHPRKLPGRLPITAKRPPGVQPELPPRSLQECRKKSRPQRGRVAPPPFPRHRRHPLAPRGGGSPYGAILARSRIARHHTEVFGVVERDGEGAGEDEDAVLKERHAAEIKMARRRRAVVLAGMAVTST
jgi:integrase